MDQHFVKPVPEVITIPDVLGGMDYYGPFGKRCGIIVHDIGVIGHYNIGMAIGQPFQKSHQRDMNILGLIGHLLGILLLACLVVYLEMGCLQKAPIPVQRH